MNSFGQRLKTLRKEAGVSQSYIADHIGVSTQSISNWECDNTMPDISQIIPLAALLSISTDYLLGVGTNENKDKKELEKKINEIWATYSVNSTKNNADLLVYELYREYLNKYPLDYAVKYKCALAIKDYLYVAAVRKKFEISNDDFEKFWFECDRILRSICDNCTLPEIQIDAQNCLIDLLLMKGKLVEAESAAMKLPDICGIKDKAICKIAQVKGEPVMACEKSENVCKQIMIAYVNALFYRAKILSENPNEKSETVIMAWDDMKDASIDLIRLYLSPSDLTVNGYEKNPYCYLITADTSKSNYLLRQGKITDAISCMESAVKAALDMFSWAKQYCTDPLVMSDILFFAQHTPRWCYKWAETEYSKEFSSNDRFKECVEKVRKLSL